MATTIRLGSIIVDVVKKDIKNIHLSVYPPSGRVRISAPLRMKLDTIRVFVISKLIWIKEQQKQLAAQERETPRSYSERESHYFWGKRYLMKLVEEDSAPGIELRHNRIVFRVRPTWSCERKREFIDAWYRAQLKNAVPKLLARWEPAIGVKVDRVFVQRMRTKWGSCSRTSAAIRLNTDLAKKPPECLEYIVVHEISISSVGCVKVLVLRSDVCQEQRRSLVSDCSIGAGEHPLFGPFLLRSAYRLRYAARNRKPADS